MCSPATREKIDLSKPPFVPDINGKQLHKLIMTTGRFDRKFVNVQGHSWAGEVPQPDPELHQRLLRGRHRLRCDW